MNVMLNVHKNNFNKRSKEIYAMKNSCMETSKLKEKVITESIWMRGKQRKREVILLPKLESLFLNVEELVTFYRTSVLTACFRRLRIEWKSWLNLTKREEIGDMEC